MKLNSKGFKLIELLVGVSIIGFLSVIVIPQALRARDRAIRQACLANIRQIQGALEIARSIDKVDIENLSETEIAALAAPDYLRSMPDCRHGDYSTDDDGTVHCSEHAP